jgi:hypothetical protein
MIGGPPMRFQPQFTAPPMQAYPGGMPVQGPAPQTWQQPAAQVPPPQQFRPAPATAQQSSPPSLVRAKPYDEPAPKVKELPVTNEMVHAAPFSLPSPEELGVPSLARSATTPAAGIDWNAAHEHLRQLGGIGIQSVPLPGSGHRVALVLRTSRDDQVHHIEVNAATEAEAMNAAFARAEEWIAAGR